MGTGVESLKELANFFSSVNLTSLSALALLLRAFSAFCRCWLANDLNSFRTSCSTVEVALGAAVLVPLPEGLREALALSTGFVSAALPLAGWAVDLGSLAGASAGLTSAGAFWASALGAGAFLFASGV